MSLRFCFVLLIVKILGDVSALVELPQVEDNNILETDTAIRNTTNKLFSILKLKTNKERLTLKQYSLIHNYLVSNSLHDYTNLIEIAKLTRVDKTKLSNETRNFMTIVNEILDEDIKHEETEDEFVLKHIEGFITNLEKYTDTYQYNEHNLEIIIAEILKLLEKNESFTDAYYNTSLDRDYDQDWLESSDENDTVIDDNEFWKPNQPNARRIFMGKPTKITEFPFISSIQIFNHFQCSGSIIKSDLIVTAASCLQLAWNNRFFRENPAFLSARVGSRFHNGGGENIPILEVYFHPEYDPKSLLNNLCVLRLWRQLKLTSKKNKRVKKIDIDRQKNVLPSNTAGITIVGWGARHRSNIITEPYLSFDVLDFYSLEECRDIYSRRYVTKRNFCAGFISRGAGACNRDVGAPGIYRGILVGVVSFGSPVCGTPDAPTVFTKLGFYSDWIDEIMQQSPPVQKQKTTTLRPFVFTIPTDITQLSTDFKIKPLEFTKKKKKRTTTPISVDDVEALRVLKEQGLLKNFVDTVIGSEEAKKMLQELNITGGELRERTTPVRMTFTYSPVTTLEPPTVKSTIGLTENSTEAQARQYDYLEAKEVDSYESVEDRKEKGKKSNKRQNKKKLDSDEYVLINQKKDLTHKLEKDIVNIIDEIHLEELVKDKVKVKNKKNKNKQSLNKNKDIFSLLYVSDSDGDVSSFSDDVKDSFSNENGLDIATDLFRGISNRNYNETDDLFISKKELLHIVSEALKEELNKTVSAVTTLASATEKGTTSNVTTKGRPTRRKSLYKQSTTDSRDKYNQY